MISTGGSAARILPRYKAEPMNDSASVIRATGAVRSWTSTPASGGPPTKASARLPENRAFACTNASRRTTATSSVFHAMSKMTAIDPARKPTT